MIRMSPVMEISTTRLRIPGYIHLSFVLLRRVMMTTTVIQTSVTATRRAKGVIVAAAVERIVIRKTIV